MAPRCLHQRQLATPLRRNRRGKDHHQRERLPRRRRRTGRCTAESAHTKASRDASSPAASDGSPRPGCLGPAPDALVLVPVSGLSPAPCLRPVMSPAPPPNLMAADPGDGRLGQGRLRVKMSRELSRCGCPAVTDGLDRFRESQMLLRRVRGRTPTLPPAYRPAVPGLIRRLAPVWRCQSRLRRAGPGTGRLCVLPGRSAGTRCRGSRCTGRAARCGCG